MEGSDKIILQGMSFYAYHGLTPAEQELGQRYEVDLETEIDLAPAAHGDNIARTIDYSELHRRVEAVITGERYHLLETIAEKIATSILAYPDVHKVKVRVKKPLPPIPGRVEAAAVEITRKRG